MQPDDATLTRDGLAPSGRGRVLLIACGALAREILALIGQNGWDHLDLHCLPAILHNRPDRIAPAVEAAVTARGAGYERVFVVYADCGTGGDLACTCERLGVGMIGTSVPTVIIVIAICACNALGGMYGIAIGAALLCRTLWRYRAWLRLNSSSLHRSNS